MPFGVVAHFNEEKGFGWITPDSGGPDLFLHKSGLVGIKRLREGERVDYVVEDHPEGPRAVEVMQI